MSEVVSINGYDIKDLKAIRTYTNITLMKSDLKLKEGMYVKTKGYYSADDGGSAEYYIRTKTNEDVEDNMLIHFIGNSLVAELITDDLINICQVGGQENFSDVCNALLNNGKSIYIPKRTFTATDTIVISQDNTQLICDGNINFTTENSTLLSIQNQRALVKFNETLTCPTNSVCIEICGGSNMVRAINLYVHYIAESKIAILINPNESNGFQSSQITFDRINGVEAGIKFNPGDIGTPWINGNVFNGGQISSQYPIVTRKGANQTDRFNQNTFNNIVFTGRTSIQTYLDLQFMARSWFNQLRMSEDFGGTDRIILDNCEFVYIENFSYLEISSIKILNSRGLSYPNYFKGSYIRDTGDHWLSSEAYEINGKFILKPGTIFNDSLSSLEATENTNQFTLPDFYNNNMVVKIGGSDTNLDLTYTLPDAIDRRGVTEFYLLVTFKDTTSKFTINDSTNTSRLILNTGTELINKLYNVKIAGKGMGNSIAPNWKVTEVNLVNI